MKAYVWSPPTINDRLWIILSPAPRLQRETESGWSDRPPTTWPRALFAKLAEVLTEIEDLDYDRETNGGEATGVLEKCFEVVEIEED